MEARDNEYSFQSRVRFSEIDHTEKITLPGIINYFQDCSNFHAEDRNVGLTWTRENHAAWILAGWQSRSYGNQNGAAYVFLGVN